MEVEQLIEAARKGATPKRTSELTMPAEIADEFASLAVARRSARRLLIAKYLEEGKSYRTICSILRRRHNLTAAYVTVVKDAHALRARKVGGGSEVEVASGTRQAGRNVANTAGED
jgi:hypothetical protein